jgi:hypothetical protein
MKAIHQAAADAFLVALLFLLLPLRYSFTLLILSPVAFSDKRLAISLLEPGIAASKVMSKSQSYFAKRSSETSDWLASRDSVAEATSEDPNESTSLCNIDGGVTDSPHNSCNSGMINIIGAMSPLATSLSLASDTLGRGIGLGLARGEKPP